jgi:hypothetical protein
LRVTVRASLPIGTNAGTVRRLADGGKRVTMQSALVRSVSRFFCGALVAAWVLAPRPAAARPAYVQWMTSESRVSAAQAPAAPTDSLDGGADAQDDGSADADAKDSAPSGYVPYQGGPVITQLREVTVLWSKNVDSTVATKIGGLYDTLTSGSFMHFVSEYKTPTQTPGAYGTVAGTFTITPINANTTLTDTDVYTELAQQIAAGNLPAADDNTVFMVYLPPGVGINDPRIGASCVPSGFCGYHKSNGSIIYGLIPDFSQGGCAPGPPGCTSCCGDKTAFENLTMVSSHELMEAVTDPKPFDQPAWINVLAGEIGDLCSYARSGENAFTTVVARDGTTYQAQKGWSNAAYLVHMGTPDGCQDYPTTLCCNDTQSQCTWLANGSTTCPNPTGNNPDAMANPNGVVLTAPTVGGFGSAAMTVTRQAVGNFNSFPLGITDWLSGPALVTSPTINMETDVLQLGDASACFAFVTNASQRGIWQCVPDVPSIPCNKPGQRLEQTANGILCCTKLAAQQSPDGSQFCAPVARIDPPPPPAPAARVPATAGPAIALYGIVLLGVGTVVVRRRGARA